MAPGDPTGPSQPDPAQDLHHDPTAGHDPAQQLHHRAPSTEGASKLLGTQSLERFFHQLLNWSSVPISLHVSVGTAPPHISSFTPCCLCPPPPFPTSQPQQLPLPWPCAEVTVPCRDTHRDCLAREQNRAGACSAHTGLIWRGENEKPTPKNSLPSSQRGVCTGSSTSRPSVPH